MEVGTVVTSNAEQKKISKHLDVPTGNHARVKDRKEEGWRNRRAT